MKMRGIALPPIHVVQFDAVGDLHRLQFRQRSWLLSQDSCRPAILLPSRERPMCPRALDDALEILSQEVTLSNQIHRRTANSLQVVVDASISLFERQARITIGIPR